MADAANAPMTASAQWLERTLDDSANRRISPPGVLPLRGRHPARHAERDEGSARQREDRGKLVSDYLPFIATENLMMAAVKRGGDLL